MKKLIIIIHFLLTSFLLRAQYIVDVLEYVPAPGQFVNTSTAGSPVISTNSIMNGLTGCLTLGSFGGYVVFKFEKPVENHPDNPYGVDFTIFGNPNAMPGTNHALTAEPGIVYVMKDENANGLPDDIWYELAGSDHFFSTTIRNYEVTYFNPGSDVAEDVPWEDNLGNTGYILANFYHNQPYYPMADSFPEINQNQYTLRGTLLENRVDMTNPQMVSFMPRTFGYVDNNLRGEDPFGIPDNPYTRERENSGGDAFDISWAIDENDNYVDLDEIDFVKVQSAVLADGGWIGEISTEIAGAIDIEPDASINGIESIVVVKDLPKKIHEQNYQLEAFVFHQGRYLNDAEITWETSLNNVNIDDNNVMTFSNYGEVEITARWNSNPDVYAVVTTILIDDDGVNDIYHNDFNIYPNPVRNHFYVESENDDLDIEIYDMMGKCIFIKKDISKDQRIDISELNSGIYFAKIKKDNQHYSITKITKF